MLPSFSIRRLIAAGFVAAFAMMIGHSAEARPHRHGYSSHSFKHLQQRRYEEYYGNAQRYGYQYALQADAYRYGHLYVGQERHRAARYASSSRREARRFERRYSERSESRRHARSVLRERAARVPSLPQVDATVPSGSAASQASPGNMSRVVAEARRYIGGNPTGRRSLWCARFMNMVLARSGMKTTGSDMASSFARYGRRVSGPQIGAIAVMSRGRRGGHVGVVSGIDAKGNPIVVSGNHSRRVAEAVYSRSRVYAYVMPD
jgi:uncharacterized protein (TIGR02594 family)